MAKREARIEPDRRLSCARSGAPSVAGVRGDREVGYAPEKLRLNSSDDPLSDLILDRENIRHLDVVAIGPDVMIIGCIDQLH
jgi:hypothetical protein